MTSRENILQAVKDNQPEQTALPQTGIAENHSDNLIVIFATVLKSIGGQLKEVTSTEQIDEYLKQRFPDKEKVMVVGYSSEEFPSDIVAGESHNLANIEMAIIHAEFGVAENAACWITEKDMGDRALPFISQNLGIILKADNLVANMHQAYQKIANQDYGFATFIAGPSKTADIEQSLVLGAHGPKSLVVFLLS